MTWCVLAADEELPPLPLLAGALAAARGLDRDTAAIEARRCWGILGCGLDETAAAGLQETCGALGVRTLRLAEEGLPRLPAPAPAKKVVFEGGLAVFTLEGAPRPCPPASVTALAAAPVKEEFFRTVKTTEGPSSGERALRMGIMAVTGLPIGLGKSRELKKEVKGSELSFYLDLLLDGGRERLRVSSDDFNFSGLKEKKTFSSQVNFRLLCAELAAFAPGAARNAGLRALLAGKPLAPLPYDSLADLEKETLRLLLIKKGTGYFSAAEK